MIPCHLIILLPSPEPRKALNQMDNFAWWHRMRRHKVERSDEFHDHDWTKGLLAFTLHCRTCNSAWFWTVQ
jgi:hypothetical protein